MRAILVTATLAACLGVFGVAPAAAQQTTGNRTTTGTSIGNNSAFSQTGQVLDASSFGGAGMGNSLRAATLGGMMGMNSAGMNMMGMNSMGMGMGMGMNRMGMGGMGMGGMGMGGMGMGGQGNAPALKIPIRLGDTLGRTPFASATPVRATRFEKRLVKLRNLNTGTGIEVEVRAGTATLTGTVPTDRDRELIEQMALLEPGIERVENELEVDPASDLKAEELPRSSAR